MDDRYGDRQDSIFSARRCAQELWDRLGIDHRASLGCGAYGCVYKQKGTPNVVKIVAGRGAQLELEASRALITLHKQGTYHPQLPLIYEIWEMGRCAVENGSSEVRDEGAFAFVREDLVDAPWDADLENDDEAHELWNVVYVLHALALTGSAAERFHAEGKRYEARNYREQVKFLRQDLKQALEVVTKDDAARLLAMTPLFEWGFAHDIDFKDAHAANWGIRPATGELVLRDIGLAESSVPGEHLPDDPTIEITPLSGAPLVFRGLYR